jgi:hypothetical protein
MVGAVEMDAVPAFREVDVQAERMIRVDGTHRQRGVVRVIRLAVPEHPLDALRGPRRRVTRNHAEPLRKGLDVARGAPSIVRRDLAA